MAAEILDESVVLILVFKKKKEKKTFISLFSNLTSTNNGKGSTLRKVDGNLKIKSSLTPLSFTDGYANYLY